jgi:sulfur carrier protein
MSNRAEPSFSIELNGESYLLEGDVRLTGLVEKLSLRRGRIAIELNQSVVPKAEWASVSLRPGDKVEIVNFVGGG